MYWNIPKFPLQSNWHNLRKEKKKIEKVLKWWTHVSASNLQYYIERKWTQEYNVHWLLYVLKVSTLNHKKIHLKNNSIQNRHFITISQINCFISIPNLRPSFIVYMENLNLNLCHEHKMSNRNSWSLKRHPLGILD